MRILWVNNIFLHPTTKGGQIRTLEMLRRLHARHEIHYVAFDDGESDEAVPRSKEYCREVYPVPFRIAGKQSPQFYAQLAEGLFSSLPVVVARKRSEGMARRVRELLAQHHFDSVVCDFLTPAVNFPSLAGAVLFQHNVETTIWDRRAENARGAAEGWFLRRQARLVREYEGRKCREAAHVAAVSEEDAARMREMFGAGRVTAIPTGVDIEYFAPPPAGAMPGLAAELVFVGSMDWLPNVDGMRWFMESILPRVREKKPGCRVVIAGRKPSEEVLGWARRDAAITVTGTVPNIRPYLWNSAVSIVPLRIGGGTRLKIYEAMAARIPVVSTTIGAEGLAIDPPHNIRIADAPEAFAAACLRLLDSAAEREAVAGAAWRMVSEHFSWEQVTGLFESILLAHPYGRGRA